MMKGEIVQEILIVFHAKHKLDEIIGYLKATNNDKFFKEKLLTIIEKDEMTDEYF